MSFDLRITFTGMCLFAPHPTTGRMHALLPSFQGAGNDPAHQHYPVLIYDVAYELPNSPQFLRRLACVPLDRTSLSLPQPVGSTATLVLPDEVADLDRVVGQGSLPKRYLTSDPNPELDCRVTMSAGAVTDYKLGEYFLFGGGEARRMTWQLEWTIRGIQEDRLQWRLQALTSADPQPPGLETLYPIGGVIHIKIHNVTCQYLPKRKVRELPGYKAAEHFEGYYELINKPSLTIPLNDKIQATEYSECSCEEVEAGAQQESSHHHAGTPHGENEASALVPPSESGFGFGGSPVTCVITKATFEP
jgi:hypothetical protein